MKHRIALIDSKPYYMRAILLGYGWSKLGVWVQLYGNNQISGICRIGKGNISHFKRGTYLFLFL